MIYIDHHVHTNYSPDSEADVREYLLRAKALGQKYVMFTDHIDMGAIDVDFQEHIDYKNYFQVMENLQEEYGIHIQVGVEIGYEKSYKYDINEFLTKYPFDFVIASIHYGDGKDFYLGDFFEGKSQQEAYLRYFEILLEMVENFSNFDVVGHLDYIIRYGPFDDKSYEYKDYKEIIDYILKAIIKKNKGIEINTSGMRSFLNTTFPNRDVLSRYKELGGKIITLGSDAHTIEDYKAGIVDAMDLLRSLGFDKVASFTKREPRVIYL